MAYLNLLIRERADLAADAEQYKKDIEVADNWVQKALETRKIKAARMPAARRHHDGSQHSRPAYPFRYNGDGWRMAPPRLVFHALGLPIDAVPAPETAVRPRQPAVEKLYQRLRRQSPKRCAREDDLKPPSDSAFAVRRASATTARRASPASPTWSTP